MSQNKSLFRVFLAGMAILLSLDAGGFSRRGLDPFIDGIQATAEVGWERDIVPLLARCICVSEDEIMGKKLIKFSFDKDGSDAPQSAAQVADSSLPPSIREKLIQTFFMSRTSLGPLSFVLLIGDGYSLKWGALYENWQDVALIPAGFFYTEWKRAGKAVKAADIPGIREEFTQALFADPLILRMLMPRIHSVLKNEGVTCQDCPGPEATASIKEFAFQDLIPYLAKKYRLAKINKDGSFSFHIGDLRSLLARGGDHDPDLIIAVELLTTLNEDMDEALHSAASVCMKKYKKELKQLAGDEQKVSFLQIKLNEELASNVKIRSTVLKKAKHILPLAGMKCTDGED